MKSELPSECYGVLPAERHIVRIKKGESGYYTMTQPKLIEGYTIEQYADDLNDENSVSKAQRAAMEHGSMFGWDGEMAKPESYDENGKLLPPKPKYVPQFKDLKFDSAEDLHKWLLENACYVVELVDFGQDLLKVWIHESGEILDCNAHQSIYVGKFVDTNLLVEGNCLWIYDDIEQKFMFYMRLIADKIALKTQVVTE